MAQNYMKVSKGLDIPVGLSLNEQTMYEIKKKMATYAASLGDELNQQIQAKANAKQIQEILTNGLQEFNRVLKSYGLEGFNIADFKDMEKPFEELGKQAAQRFMDGFKLKGEALDAITETVDKINKKIVEKTDAYGSKTLRELQEAGERYNKKTSHGNRTRDAIDIDNILSEKYIHKKSKLTPKEQLSDLYEQATNSNKTWEQRYVAEIQFVKYYEDLSASFAKNGTTMSAAFEGNADTLKQINNLFISLSSDIEDKIAMLKNVQEYDPSNPTSFKYGYNHGEPWARESTLKEVKNILEQGIKVDSSGGGKSSSNPPNDNPPSGGGGSSSNGSNPPPPTSGGAGTSPTLSANEEEKKEKELNAVNAILDVEDKIIQEQVRALQGHQDALQNIKELNQELANAKRAFAKATGKKYGEVNQELNYREKLNRPIQVQNDQGGQEYDIWRGFSRVSEKKLTREEALKKYGADFYADRVDVAATYAKDGDDPTLFHGKAKPKNPLIIDAQGGTFNEYDKLTIGDTPIVNMIPELFQNLQKDETKRKEAQAVIAEWAAKQGADAVVVKNVLDTMDVNPKDEPTTTVAVLDDAIAHIDDVLRGQENADDPDRLNWQQGKVPDWYDTTGIIFKETSDEVNVLRATISELSEALKRIVKSIENTTKDPVKAQLEAEQAQLKAEKAKEQAKLDALLSGDKVQSSESEKVGSKTQVDTSVQASEQDVIYKALHKSENEFYKFVQQYNKEWQSGLKVFREHFFTIIDGKISQIATGDITSSNLVSQAWSANTIGHTHPSGNSYSKQDINTMQDVFKQNKNFDRDILVTQDKVLEISGLKSLRNLPQEVQDQFFASLQDAMNSIPIPKDLSSSAEGLIKNSAIKLFVEQFASKNGLGEVLKSTLGYIDETGNIVEDYLSEDELKQIMALKDLAHKRSLGNIKASTYKKETDKFYSSDLYTKLSAIQDPMMEYDTEDRGLFALVQNVLDQKTDELSKLYDAIKSQLEKRVFDKTEDMNALPEYLKRLKEFFDNNTSKSFTADAIKDLKIYYDTGNTSGLESRYSKFAEQYNIDFSTRQGGMRDDSGISEVEQIRANIARLDQLIEEKNQQIQAAYNIDPSAIIKNITDAVNEIIAAATASIPLYNGITDELKKIQNTISNIDINSEAFKTTLEAAISRLTKALNDGADIVNAIKTAQALSESKEQIPQPITTSSQNPSELPNSQTNEQSAEDPRGPWALEKTLSGEIKQLLTDIKDNTSKESKTEIALSKEVIDNFVSSLGDKLKVTGEFKSEGLATQDTVGNILTAVESINKKILEGTKVIKTGKSDEKDGTKKKKKPKDGTINHGETQGEYGSDESVIDYYYWLKEQAEQYKDNSEYVTAINKVLSDMSDRVKAAVDKNKLSALEDSAINPGDPDWYKTLKEKHTLHMAKITGNEDTSKEKQAIEYLKEEYDLRRKIADLQKVGASDETLEPLKLRADNASKARFDLVASMSDDEVAAYADMAAPIKDAQAIKDNTKAIRDQINTAKQLEALYEKIGKLMYKRDQAPNDEIKNAYNEEIILLEEIADAKSKNITLDETIRKNAVQSGYNQQNIKTGESQANADARKSIQAAKFGRAETVIEKSNALKNQIDKWADDQELINQNEKVEKFKTSLETLQKKKTELSKQKSIDPQDAKDFNNLRFKTEELRKETEKLISTYQTPLEIAGETAYVSGDILTYEKQLANMAKQITNGKAKIGEFDAKTNTLNYTVQNGAKELEHYTLSVQGVDKSVAHSFKSVTQVETFFDAVLRKTKEVSQYLLGSLSVNRLFSELRQGIQYVKEIDAAMTELRKVTDETEETYDKFMQTASKTASKVGSTIKDVVSSVADFARLGYSLEEAAELAENAQILMNVSEYTDISSATDALISALKAFGYESSESLHVIDIFNTIEIPVLLS